MMNEKTIISKVEKEYNEKSYSLEYLGVLDGLYCFGIILKDIQKTVDLPLYLTATKKGLINRTEMPVYSDDAYKNSLFATIESEFRFFEKNDILEPEDSSSKDEAGDDLLISRNKFDPSQKRDRDGKWTDGGVFWDIADGLGDFESKVRNDKSESFYAEDEDGNEIILKKGGRNKVEFSPEEMASLRTYMGVVATHNHPSDNSFSKDDLVFGSRINAKEIRVVSSKFDYSFKPANGVWSSEEEMTSEFEKISDEAIKDFVKPHQDGRISTEELVLLWSDKIMLNFAKRFGGEYTKETVENE